MRRILWGIFLIYTLTLPVAAYGIPDLSQLGSISITMRYQKEPVSGGELTIYRVGDINEDNGNYRFVLTADFAEANVSLENVQASETAKKLSTFTKQQKVSGQKKVIGKNGKVTFENLQPALYLVVQTRAAQDYYAVNPFLVSLPMLESGAYSYQVDASPKVSPIPKPDHPEPPQTGQPGWPIWTFGLSAAALVILHLRKKHI